MLNASQAKIAFSHYPSIMPFITYLFIGRQPLPREVFRVFRVYVPCPVRARNEAIQASRALFTFHGDDTIRPLDAGARRTHGDT